MKPSNTGIDWLKEWQECEDVPVLSAMLVYKGDTDKGFIDLCEWAAQIYRKEARAEWKRELAVKVGGAIDEVIEGGMDDAEGDDVQLYALSVSALTRKIRALILNENDDER